MEQGVYLGGLFIVDTVDISIGICSYDNCIDSYLASYMSLIYSSIDHNRST
jgi:hypothetical protein